MAAVVGSFFVAEALKERELRAKRNKGAPLFSYFTRRAAQHFFAERPCVVGLGQRAHIAMRNVARYHAYHLAAAGWNA